MLTSARYEDAASTINDNICGCEERCIEWVATVDRAAATVSNGPFTGDGRHTALAAIAPHFPYSARKHFSDDDVAGVILSDASWVTEARSQRIGTVLEFACHEARISCARQRRHGHVGVDHADSMVRVPADDDEALTVFDDGGDAVRMKEP